MKCAEAYFSSFEKAFKALPKNIKELTKNEFIPSIIVSPCENEMLSGNLNPCRSFHFIDNRTHYRILYLYYNCRIKTNNIDLCLFTDFDHSEHPYSECLGRVEFLYIGSRQSIYNEFAKNLKIKQFLRDFTGNH